MYRISFRYHLEGARKAGITGDCTGTANVRTFQKREVKLVS